MKVQNIVATVKAAATFDLHELASKLGKATFGPKATWLKLRLQPGNKYIAFYRSGKFLVTGVKSDKELHATVNQVRDELTAAGIDLDIRSVKIHNIVVLDEIHLGRSLHDLAVSLRDSNVMYEPEQFPGLIYRHGGSTFLLFGSGKVISTGNKSFEMAKRNLSHFGALLKSFEA